MEREARVVLFPTAWEEPRPANTHMSELGSRFSSIRCLVPRSAADCHLVGWNYQTKPLLNSWPLETIQDAICPFNLISAVFWYMAIDIDN